MLLVSMMPIIDLMYFMLSKQQSLKKSYWPIASRFEVMFPIMPWKDVPNDPAHVVKNQGNK